MIRGELELSPGTYLTRPIMLEPGDAVVGVRNLSELEEVFTELVNRHFHPTNRYKMGMVNQRFYDLDVKTFEGRTKLLMAKRKFYGSIGGLDMIRVGDDVWEGLGLPRYGPEHLILAVQGLLSSTGRGVVGQLMEIVNFSRVEDTKNGDSIAVRLYSRELNATAINRQIELLRAVSSMNRSVGIRLALEERVTSAGLLA